MATAALLRPDYRRVKLAVNQLLTEFNIVEPPVDPVRLSRELGVEVIFATFAESDNNISGFYDFEENAIYVNKNEFPLRQTFTVAHELGHKVLHEEWAKSSDYRILLRDQLFDSDDPNEKEANAFAANLLVPRVMLDKYWRGATEEQLSQLFAVSVPVIRNRLAFEYGVR
jgi:Zn-dependent peptidase ImmA (M78 family)